MMPTRPRWITFVSAYLVGELLYRTAAAEQMNGYAHGFADGIAQGRELERVEALVDPDRAARADG